MGIELCIHSAVMVDNLEKVRQLIEAGVPVDSLDGEGQTPLHIAALYGLYEIAKLLLNNECDLNAVDQRKNTPLMNTVVLGMEEVAVLLIRAGADVNRSDGQKRTALHRAAELAQIKMIQILLEKEGLHLSPQDADGNTPLHRACKFLCRREAITQLLDAGADINMRNNQGETSLNIVIGDYSIEYHVEDIGWFVQRGAFLENCDYECISRKPFLKDEVLKDVELCTQSVVNKFNCQSLPALNSIPYFARRLPNVDNFKLGARHIDEVKNLVRCEIERNTFCNVVKVHPIALSALCVRSLITCQSSKKRAASTGFGNSPCKKIRNR